MSPLVRPFRALRPRPETAAAVIAPPYDVVDAEEARALAADRPQCFLHVSRPEIDFPRGVDAHSDPVYARGAANLAALVAEGVLERETEPCYYLYRMTMGAHTQTGIALTASVRAYDANRVRKHELTRPDKENDRVRNIEALNAQTGPVLCAFKSNAAIDALVASGTRTPPLLQTEGPNAVVHALWRVADPAAVAQFSVALNALEALYIADGHHRSAAASRVAAARRAAGAGPEASHEYFLSVAFPSAAMRIYDYNRVVADLGGASASEFLARLEPAFGVEPSAAAVEPDRPGTFGLYLGGRWYRLTLREAVPANDPVAALDVSLLQSRLIEPLLGIADPRTDPRIDFVGGIRGLGALEQRIDSGSAAAAFALYPTSMEQLMAVADAERLMPPKSTWFEPKLADGLLSHVLD